MDLELYSDGGCHNHGSHKGVGSWAWVVVSVSATGETQVMLRDGSGHGEEGTTNNRMEYGAFLNGVKWMLENQQTVREATGKPGNLKVYINAYSDSQLLVNTYNQWMRSWKRSGVIGEKKNPDLIRELLELPSALTAANFQLKLSWVRGHNGNRWNEHCDALCTKLISEKTGYHRDSRERAIRVPRARKTYGDGFREAAALSDGLLEALKFYIDLKPFPDDGIRAKQAISNYIEEMGKNVQK